MAAESLYLRSTTFTAGTSWLKAYADGLRDNTIRLGRTRYTAGEVALAQADAEIGALHVSSTKILRLYRQSGTGTSDDATRAALSTPIRGVWHYDDNAGDPSSAASVEGDLLVRDAGTNDAWLESYEGTSYRGLGVLAENRTTATAGSPRQASGKLCMRSQAHDGVSTTRYLDTWTQVDHAVDGDSGSEFSYLSIRRQPQSGDEVVMAFLHFDHPWGASGINLDETTLELVNESVNVAGNSYSDGFAAGYR